MIRRREFITLLGGGADGQIVDSLATLGAQVYEKRDASITRHGNSP